MKVQPSDDSRSDPRVAFMLMRIMGVCLTAGRGTVKGTAPADFDIADGSLDGISNIFYRPLLMLFNTFRLAGSFQSVVVGAIQGLLRGRESLAGSWKVVDFQETAQRRMSGIRDIAFYTEPDSHEADLYLAALIVEEFRYHVKATRTFVSKQAVLANNDAVRKVLASLERREASIEGDLDRLNEGLALPLSKARDELRTHFEDFDKILEPPALESKTDPYLSYQLTTAGLFNSKCHNARKLRLLVNWRQNYLALKTGVGVGNALSFVHARDAPYLFEIWCFVELASILSAMGFGKLAQRSLLRRKESSTYKFENGAEVYYDFLGSVGRGYEGDRVLSESHVEWFIKNFEEPEKSVLIDAKYKSWRSADNLAVLGYMNDFGVDRGVVIFRDDLRIGAYNSPDAGPGIAIKRFGRSKEKIFCALCLKPEKSFMDQNRKILTEFVQKVILAS